MSSVNISNVLETYTYLDKLGLNELTMSVQCVPCLSPNVRWYWLQLPKAKITAKLKGDSTL